jgi:hypothetical protein
MDWSKYPERAIKNMMVVAINSRLFNTNGKIGNSSIENDRRKLKSIIKGLIEEGYLEGGGEDMTVTAKIYDEIEAKKPNLFEQWSKQYVKWKDCTKEPVVLLRIHEFVFQPAEMKWLVENAASYKWLVASTKPWQYGMPFRKEEHLRDGIPNLDVAKGVWCDMSDRWEGWTIAVTDDELAANVKRFMIKTHYEELRPQHLGWGLVKAGILDEEEGESVKSEAPFLSPVFSSANISGGVDPDKWGERIERVLDKNIALLAEIQKKMTVLRKIEKGVAVFGGWPKFVQWYSDRLLDHITEELEKADAEAKETEAKEEPAAV